MEPRRRALFGYEPPRRPPSDEVPSVSALVHRARQTVEGAFTRVRVRGEVSNLVRAGSGHIYFTLKDDKAQLAAVMWRAAAARLAFPIEQGSSVVAEGRLTIYEARGSFQLVVERLEEAGVGELEAQFRALEKRYREAGWFDESLKKPLPYLPTCVGIVTSDSGAALHDILQTLYGRHPKARVLLAPSRVQGQGAAEEIAAALRRLDESGRVDVIIVGRGGGSLEDLWAFNEPAVIEAIHTAQVPIISAVGHEVDVTLSDLVADRRALTPTAAGECVVPELAEVEAFLETRKRRLRREVEARLEQARLRLATMGQSWALREPKELVRRAGRQLDELRRALPKALTIQTQRHRAVLDRLGNSPALLAVPAALALLRERLVAPENRLGAALKRQIESRRERLEARRAVLDSLSPLAVLGRGYSITRVASSGDILRNPREAPLGTRIETTLSDGQLESIVDGSSDS